MVQDRGWLYIGQFRMVSLDALAPSAMQNIVSESSPPEGMSPTADSHARVGSDCIPAYGESLSLASAAEVNFSRNLVNWIGSKDHPSAEHSPASSRECTPPPPLRAPASSSPGVVPM